MIRILVVDDDVQMRELLGKLFTEKGWEFVSVPSVAQAVGVIARERLDLIVLDVSMPEESGLSFLEKIKQTKKETPVIIFSGFVSPETEKVFLDNGASACVSKNGDIGLLVKAIEAKCPASRKTGESPAAKKKALILVVDDEPAIRKVLGAFFHGKNYEIVEASNGSEAIEAIRSKDIALVLLDIMMPGEDGLSVLTKLRAEKPALGVIMVTGRGDDDMVQKAMTLGAYSYVLKPFDFLYLELVVTAGIKARSGA